MRGLPVIDLEYYRDLHIQLRNDYRTDESARALVSRITATHSLGCTPEQHRLDGRTNPGVSVLS